MFPRTLTDLTDLISHTSHAACITSSHFFFFIGQFVLRDTSQRQSPVAAGATFTKQDPRTSLFLCLHIPIGSWDDTSVAHRQPSVSQDSYTPQLVASRRRGDRRTCEVVDVHGGRRRRPEGC